MTAKEVMGTDILKEIAKELTGILEILLERRLGLKLKFYSKNIIIY